MAHGVKIEFADGASWIWHHHDFRLQQDRPQAPLRLEYGNFTPGNAGGRRSGIHGWIRKKTPEKASVFVTATGLSGSVDCSGCYLLWGNRHLKKWLHVNFLEDLNMIFRLK